MLLYTRLAPPKIPKKRSRAGCTYCKEKKKKCDEARPQCARCAEHGRDCAYEAAKPRQRRKRTSETGLAKDADFMSPYEPDGDAYSWDDDVCTRDQLLEQAVDPPARSAGRNVVCETSPMFPHVEATAFQLSYGDGFGGIDEIGEEPDDSDLPVILHPELAAAAPASVSVGSPHLGFLPPRFIEFSDRPNRRALVDHFCSVLSHLVVFREESGNPFQKLVLPLCYQSEAVTNAIYALTSAHLEYRGVGNGEKSVAFHHRAIRALAGLLDQGGKVNKNEFMAAIMLLVYYEVLVQKRRTNIVDGHLKGAMTVLSTNSENSDPTSTFLERAFRFYDVIAALSLGTAPLSQVPCAEGLLPFPQPETETSLLSNVDSLLGMATTLWPTIHRLSGLLPLKKEMERAVAANDDPKAAELRTRFETTSHAIDMALKQWQPTLPENFWLAGDGGDGDDGADERARLQSTLNNALAYRHSALIYLYRTIYGYPRSHALVQRHAHVALTHCVTTVLNQGPMGALLWPLFVASCEAVTLGDRDLARQAFVAVDQRQGMMNIERAWVIVQEVWRRADLMEAAWEAGLSDCRDSGPKFKGRDIWRTVSEDMGVTIVFG